MISNVSKTDLLFSVRDVLKADPEVTALVPKRNISAGASDLNHVQAAICVLDGGDDIKSEIRRDVSVQVLIHTMFASLNRSDIMCSRIESAVLNCLLEDQTVSGAVSRFIEGSSEPVSESDDPNVRTRIITMKYEFV